MAMNIPARLGVIYKITNKVNGRAYVGQTVTTKEARWRAHVVDAERGSQLVLHKAIRKYGVAAFRVCVLKRVTEPLLNAAEIHFIKRHNTFGAGYNMTRGGDGCPASPAVHRRQGRSLRKHYRNNPEAGEARSAEKKAFYGTPAGARVRQRISSTLSGRKLSKYVREAHSAGLRARYANPEERSKTSAAMRAHFNSLAGAQTRAAISKRGKERAAAGDYHSEETRAKLAEAARRQWASPETRARITEARRAAGYSVSETTRNKISSTLKSTYAAHPELAQALAEKSKGRVVPRHSEFMKARWDAWRTARAAGVTMPTPNGR